ncbi:hypothetical protein EB796_009687 [Bugula neritina]|uniref:Uncharacterized protein n=1 Tax=Bugula neritina TaxID=10212 RepID=A0A7J7K351_BUGNE|nr:hypothetical protein EB796_009687 [Bugula neritina]
MAEGGALRPPSNFLLANSSQNPSDASRNWLAWLEQFDFYMLAAEKNSKPEEVQVATLLTILGAQGQELFRTFDLSEENKKKIAEVKGAFSRYFAPKIKEEFERYKFYSRVQQTEERDKALRDRIVFGIHSEAIREELFNVTEDLTLERCIAICQRCEATRQYLNDFNASSIDAGFKAHAVNDQVEAKYNHQSSRPTQHPRSTVQATSKPITNCKYCAGTHQPRKCPAYDKQCNNSGRKGHYAKVCLSKKESTATNKPKVHEVTAEDPDVVYTYIMLLQIRRSEMVGLNEFKSVAPTELLNQQQFQNI